MTLLSKRAEKFLGDPPPLVKAHFKCYDDPFIPEENPNGYINFGTAENYLMDDILAVKSAELSKTMKYTFHYDHPQGSEELRTTYSKFIEKNFNIESVPKENITVASGSSAILEMISYAFLEEKKDVITMAPLYNGFFHDLETRFQGRIIPSHCLSSGLFDIKTLEESFSQSSPSLLLINNPHNPTGFNLNESEIEGIITLAKKYDVDIIADEIYGNSLYNGEEFISFLDPRFNHLNYKENIHHVYGLAKDFCLSGLKVGFFASYNQEISKVIAQLAYFHTVSTQTQKLAQSLLSDHSWCNEFKKVNHERLKNAYTLISKTLVKNKIPFVKPSAGIFLWIDLRAPLQINSIEDEMRVHQSLMDRVKINITPGSTFSAEAPGFFRICFAKNEAFVSEFLSRFENFLSSN